jgi:hypothetical protein
MARIGGWSEEQVCYGATVVAVREDAFSTTHYSPLTHAASFLFDFFWESC